MWRSLSSPASADARRRSLSLTHSAGLPPFGLSLASVQRVRHLWEREWTVAKPVLMFALQVTVGAAAAAGAILALFAWSGAGV